MDGNITGRPMKSITRTKQNHLPSHHFNPNGTIFLSFRNIQLLLIYKQKQIQSRRKVFFCKENALIGKPLGEDSSVVALTLCS